MFIPKSGRQDYCSEQCKKQFYFSPKIVRLLRCPRCSKEFTATGSTSKFCSAICRETTRKIANRIDRICAECSKVRTDQRLIKKFCSVGCASNYALRLKNPGENGIDYVTCPICQRHVKQISDKHAKMHGFASPTDMKEKLKIETICASKKEKHRGENNPGFQHGGKFSKFSQKFIHGYDEEWHNKHVEDLKKNRKDHPEKFINTIEYWMKQCNGNEVNAKAALSKSQTRDLFYFVEKYGEEEGAKRRALKIERWAKSFKKTNFSMISQELFSVIVDQIDNKSGIYFATFDREEMTRYINKEYILKVKDTFVRPDFIDLNTKRIIEFDGQYWHSAAKTNPEREQLRDEKIRAEGYEIFHVAELKYKQEKEKVIQECINFLTK